MKVKLEAKAYRCQGQGQAETDLSCRDQAVHF